MIVVADKGHLVPLLDEEVCTGAQVIGQLASHSSRGKPTTAIAHAGSNLHQPIATVA